jgi:hypothetical protein
MVRFGHLSVTLSNAWSVKKCAGRHYTDFRLAMPIDYGLWGCFRPLRDE